MSIDEAIKNIQFVLHALDKDSKIAESYRMAIKALEQEPKTEKVIKMRDATPEEKEAIDKYIKSISKPTVVDFWDLEQEPCDDAISRSAVLDYIYNDLGLGDEENGKDIERQMELESSYKYIKSLPPIKAESCDNAISRQAVDDAIYDYSRSCDVNYAQIMEYIDKLPSVNPQEPKTDVLNKIRAEIEQIEGNEVEVSDMQGNRYKYETIVKSEALQIIDKYKAECEDKG